MRKDEVIVSDHQLAEMTRQLERLNKFWTLRGAQDPHGAIPSTRELRGLMTSGSILKGGG